MRNLFNRSGGSFISGFGFGDGDGDGDGYGSGFGYGYGDGDGYGYGDGFGSGFGYDDGSGSGDGFGFGSGFGYGDGSGSGFGSGSGGDGFAYACQLEHGSFLVAMMLAHHRHLMSLTSKESHSGKANNKTKERTESNENRTDDTGDEQGVPEVSAARH